MEGVTGKYYVSTKGTPVLKAYAHERAREEENFTGNFNDMGTFPYSTLNYKSKLISRENNWLPFNTGKIGYKHKH